MNRMKRIAVWVSLALLMVTTSGCAVIGTALSAGAAYGIYMATKK
jgi:uncharacterized protein YceK